MNNSLDSKQATVIIRYQVKLFSGGYITNNGKPLRFENLRDVNRWIDENQHRYQKRLCDVPIIRGE